MAGALTVDFAAAQQPPAPPPPAVTVVKVVKSDIAPSHSFIGRVDAIQSVQIHALVQGILNNVAFVEGSDVTAGQLLFEIAPELYQAQVKNAQAAVAKAQATLANDNTTVARYQTLAQRGDTPQATLDQAVATRNADAAGVDAAKADLETAQINLGYTRISSPIAGRIGAAAVTKGNLVSASTGALATIVELDPIRVIFSVDQNSLLSAEQTSGSSVHELTQQFLPRVEFNNGTTYDQQGELSFVSNQVDPATGTIPIYAQFPNPKHLLLPGQYLNVLVRAANPQLRLLAPVAAVQQDRDGKFVLVVGADKKVAQQRIEAVQQHGEDWVVDKGLNEGQEVIVEGLQKVRAGQVVNPQLQASDSSSSNATPTTGQ